MEWRLPEGFPSKFGAWDPDAGWIPVRYSDQYIRQSISGVHRILVCTQGSALELLKSLLALYAEPFALGYFLITREGVEGPQKYDLGPLSRSELDALLHEYEAFFEGDARHHLWIHSSSGGTLIYDEHDWIYAYGNLAEVESFLNERKFAVGLPEVPFPHLHNDSPANDEQMEKLLRSYPWKQLNVSNLS